MAEHTSDLWDSEAEFVARLERLDQRGFATETGAGFGLVLVNLVGLRHVNQTSGREVGDLVLEELTRRLRAIVSDAASIARVGPSEFAVLVEPPSASSVTQLARRIRRHASRDMTLGHRKVDVELQVTPRAGAGPEFTNILWAARSDARWERQRPLLERVKALEASVGLDADARAEIIDLARRLSAAEDIAHRDGLTGVLNRVGTEQALAELPAPFALAFVDLDDLRAFNASGDNYDAGDDALRAVARAIRAATPTGVVGRWGGDEFVIAVPDLTHSELADALREALTLRRHLPTVVGRPVSFSAGTFQVDHPGDLDTARKTAQAILRHIKDNGLKPAVLDHIPDA